MAYEGLCGYRSVCHLLYKRERNGIRVGLAVSMERKGRRDCTRSGSRKQKKGSK